MTALQVVKTSFLSTSSLTPAPPPRPNPARSPAEEREVETAYEALGRLYSQVTLTSHQEISPCSRAVTARQRTKKIVSDAREKLLLGLSLSKPQYYFFFLRSRC